MTAAAVVVAAGAGRRLAAAVPKAFVELGDAPLYLHALRTLARSDCFDHVVLVAPAELAAQASGRLESEGMAARVVAGGRTRQESVACGLAMVDADVVAVHDAARALASPELVRRVVAALDGDWDAAAPALPVVDTMKRVDPDDGRVVETVARSTLRAVQTPQVFRRDLLQRLHGEAHGADATDDLLLVEQAGGRVRLVPGEPANFKITTAFDLAVARALLVMPAGAQDGDGA